jgi:hypothetical protein
MENSQVIGTELSDENGLFEKFFRGIPVGIHTISIYSVNEDSENTITVNYNINVADATDTVVNIILPPSINIDVDRVKRPAPIIAYGQTVPNYLVRILLTGSKDNTSVETTADSDGKWSVNINPKLHLGSKTAYAISLNGQGGQSEISKAKFFTVVKSADLNNDTLVDLTDFSILMYSYAKRPIRNVLSDINDDDTVDLVDFSIMMSQWSR